MFAKRVIQQTLKQARGFALQKQVPNAPMVSGLIPVIAVGTIGVTAISINLRKEAQYQQRNWSNPDYIIENYEKH